MDRWAFVVHLCFIEYCAYTKWKGSDIHLSITKVLIKDWVYTCRMVRQHNWRASVITDTPHLATEVCMASSYVRWSCNAHWTSLVGPIPQACSVPPPHHVPMTTVLARPLIKHLTQSILLQPESSTARHTVNLLFEMGQSESSNIINRKYVLTDYICYCTNTG